LRLGKPVVWTLHDQWSFTGGCHYSAGCDKYKTRCTRCPQLLKDDYDTANKILTNKLSLIDPAKLFIVTPSRWLSKCAKESFLFRNLSVETIPNSIETDIFRPLKDKVAIKNKYNIPGDVVTILFGALSGNIKRKGFDKLMAAFDTCSRDETFKLAVQNKKIRLLCFGTPSNELDRLNIPYSSFGKISDDLELRDIYNASDFFVLPSLEDNLPNTMLEAMACGTPVIAFDVGGMPDMISDQENGRLIPAFDTVKFGRAVIDLALNKEKRMRLGMHSRELIETGYKLEDQARNYIELFSRLLPRGPAPGRPFPPREPQYCTLDVSFNPLLRPLYQNHAGEDL
ncbi:MAG: glycosyltransferase, partial [bacterium]|nr:glycosyltransferase [bacterium]